MIDIIHHLRDLVRRTCTMPLLVAGESVAVSDDDREFGTRATVATAAELVDALDSKIRVMDAANRHLKERLAPFERANLTPDPEASVTTTNDQTKPFACRLRYRFTKAPDGTCKPDRIFRVVVSGTGLAFEEALPDAMGGEHWLPILDGGVPDTRAFPHDAIVATVLGWFAKRANTADVKVFDLGTYIYGA